MKVFHISKNSVASRLVIKWPTNFADTGKEFREIAVFLDVIQETEVTYAKICPPSNQHIAYLDSTMKHSVILLALCCK